MKTIFKIIIGFLKGIGIFLLFLLFIISLLYVSAPVYKFSIAKPFSGEYLFNPYANLEGKWWKGNFQVASYSWGGITAGKDPVDEVYSQYKKYNYDIISVSDYQKINTFRSEYPDYVPTYEHGYNIFKRHHLCVGSKKVVWYDLPFFQTVSHKQFIINLIRPYTQYIALAHPKWLDAYTQDDMAKLTGYDALEVLNHYVQSTELWDAALSAGKKIWIMGNDDSHNVYDLYETMCFWTLVNAKKPHRDLILQALRKGQSISTKGREGKVENNLQFLKVDNLTMTMCLDTIAEQIRLIGQNGKERSVFNQTDSVSFTFANDDTYIRTEIIMPNSKIYLNPVFRYDGTSVYSSHASIDVGRTWAYRLPFILGYILVLFLYLRYRHKRKKPAHKRF